MLLVPLRALAGDGLQGWNPSITEKTLLPRFCWHQFMGNRFQGPEFEIPYASCGVGTNHYCPGLVLLGRANRAFNMQMKRGYLLGAQNQVGYTVTALQRYPRCPIRAQVQQTYQLIQLELSQLR